MPSTPPPIMPKSPFVSGSHNSPLRTPCLVCLDIRPSSSRPDCGQCMRCGHIAHYMDFIGKMVQSGIASSQPDSPIDPNALMDFRAMPDDIAAMKTKLDELEKTLSLFADILKHALQT